MSSALLLMCLAVPALVQRHTHTHTGGSKQPEGAFAGSSCRHPNADAVKLQRKLACCSPHCHGMLSTAGLLCCREQHCIAEQMLWCPSCTAAGN